MRNGAPTNPVYWRDKNNGDNRAQILALKSIKISSKNRKNMQKKTNFKLGNIVKKMHNFYMIVITISLLIYEVLK